MKNKLTIVAIFLCSLISFSTPVDNNDVMVGTKDNIIGGKNQDINSKYSSITIGNNTTVTGFKYKKSERKEAEYNTTIGGSITNYSDSRGTVIGYGNKMMGDNNVLVGADSSDTGGYSATLGAYTHIKGGHTVALGFGITSLKDDAITIGAHSRNMGEASIAMGRRAYAISKNAISIGKDSTATTVGSINLGNYAVNNGYESVNMGNSSKTLSDYSVTIGNRSETSAFGAIALGSNVIANRFAYVEGYNPVEEDITNFAETNKEKIEELKKVDAELQFLNSIFSEKVNNGGTNKQFRIYIEKLNERDFKLKENPNANVDSINKEIEKATTEIKNIIKKKCAGHEENEFCKIDLSNLTVEEILKKYEVQQNDMNLVKFRRGQIKPNNAAAVSTMGALSIGDADKKITRQITGVAAGSEDSDAVNVYQLKQLKKYTDQKIDTLSEAVEEMKASIGKVDSLSKDVSIANAGVSSAMAMSSINKLSSDSKHKFAIGAGMAVYNKAFSVAVGLSGVNNKRNMTYNVNLSINNKASMGISAGMTYEFKENINNNTDIENIIKTNERLIQENKEIKAQLEYILNNMKK